MNIAKTALIIAPYIGSIPNIAFNPRPAPATLPILNASPPITIKIASTYQDQVILYLQFLVLVYQKHQLFAKYLIVQQHRKLRK